jgi:hypothetical protein
MTNLMWSPVRAVAGIAALLVVWAVVSTAPARAQAQGGTAAMLTCPNTATPDFRPSPERDPARVRAIAPKAGGRASAELFSHARFAGLAYELYGVFDKGGDVRAAFPNNGLTPVAFLYGEPGPNGERGPRPARTRTFYGFIADEAATGRRYIVFRGTQEPAEWARNVQAGQRPYPSGVPARSATAHVHAGFLKIFESMEIETAAGRASLAASLPGLVADRETIFVGHSLGSALATLAGVETARRSPAIASRLRVVTLASPRVGDAGFAAMASRIGRVDRVCNLVDIVTAVPPSTREISYVHAGAPFRVSSFDWPALANDVARPTDQILCWHGDSSYTFMLDPAHARPQASQCFKAAR